MRGTAVAILMIVAILVGAAGGYLSGVTNEHTTTSISTLVSTSVSTSTATSTIVMTSTIQTNVTIVREYTPPFWYLTSDCAGVQGPGGSVGPCFGWVQPAYLFNSFPNLSMPASPYTRTYTVSDTNPPYPSYKINITLGVTDQTAEPGWANCSWSGVPPFWGGYADCISVINSTAFVMGEPQPPPP